MIVSIPSSSGHQFTASTAAVIADRSEDSFNPFFIRASVYCGSGRGKDAGRWGSFNPFFIRASVYCRAPLLLLPATFNAFQSLLHQGISLLGGLSAAIVQGQVGFQSLLHQGISLLFAHALACWRLLARCFNPFFIRASVYCTSRTPGDSTPISGFNPFFIRASVYWTPAAAAVGAAPPCFNPFFIRASVYWQGVGRLPRRVRRFQSLLHQGISLLRQVQ